MRSTHGCKFTAYMVLFRHPRAKTPQTWMQIFDSTRSLEFMPDRASRRPLSPASVSASTKEGSAFMGVVIVLPVKGEERRSRGEAAGAQPPTQMARRASRRRELLLLAWERYTSDISCWFDGGVRRRDSLAGRLGLLPLRGGLFWEGSGASGSSAHWVERAIASRASCCVFQSVIVALGSMPERVSWLWNSCGTRAHCRGGRGPTGR